MLGLNMESASEQRGSSGSSSPKEFRAVLRGSTESQNIGDRLMWGVADALLRDLNATETHRFTHWDKRFDAVPNLGNVDAVFDLGNVYYCDSFQQSLRDRVRRAIRFNRAFRQSQIVFLPCGWGPFRRADWPLIRELTRDAIIFAREQISLDYINDALGGERAHLCPDLALMCEAATPDIGQELLRNLGLADGDPLLGLIPNVRCIEQGVTPLSDPSIYYNHLKAVTAWSRANGYQVVGISHMVDTDRDRKLMEGLGVPIVQSNDPLTVRSVIANLSVAVGSRFHGLVNCLVHGVPVVSLGWQHKYRGLMQGFDLSDFDHPLDQSCDQLTERLVGLTSARERLATQISNRLLKARECILENMGRLSVALGGPSRVLTSSVRFESTEIKTHSHVRSTTGARVLRCAKRFVTA
jgi:polysaccharide pyruvyl transferase WcaK-like protein